MKRLIWTLALCASFGVSAQAFAQEESVTAEAEAIDADTTDTAEEVNEQDADAEESAEATEDAVDEAAADGAAAAAAAAAEDEAVDPLYYEGRRVGALGVSGSFNLSSLNRVPGDRKSTRLHSSHVASAYAVVCLTE